MDNESESNCDEINLYLMAEKQFLPERFPLVVIAGSIVSLIGLVCLVYLLTILWQAKFRRTNLIYYAMLTIFDILIIFNYTVLIIAGVSADFYENLPLYLIWNGYVKPMFTLGRITQVAQTYLIVAVTIDRFLCIYWKDEKKMHPTYRYRTLAGVIIFTVAFKMVTFWEVEVFYYNCTGFAQVYTKASSLFIESQNFQSYKLYIDPIFQTYLPFLVIVCANCGIIHMLNKKHERGRVRDATITMLALVTCYFSANGLHVVVTILEQTIGDQYLVEHWTIFYSFASDISSFLVLLTSSIRLPIYYLCNGIIRQEIRKSFCQKTYSEFSMTASESIQHVEEKYSHCTREIKESPCSNFNENEAHSETETFV